MELSSIRGLGDARLASLRAVGITSLRDLLMYLPVTYEDRSKLTDIRDVCVGTFAVHGKIADTPGFGAYQGLVRVTARLVDGDSRLSVIWYNQPYMLKQMTAGREVTLYGHVVEKQGRLVLQNPQVLTELSIHSVYREIKGIPGKTLHKIIESCFPCLPEVCPETLPARILREHDLMGLCEAIRQSHQPADMETLARARRRMAFEKMLMYQAAIGLMKDRRTAGPVINVAPESPHAFWDRMSFPPTGAQRRVLTEIAEDLKGPYAMSRLVQGDVGCGKTAIAFGAMTLCLEAGFQTALMAPTEILARQHYQAAQSILGPKYNVGLLVGSLKASEKKKAHQALEDGSWDVVIGTHALISENVSYRNLGLVITDEQHRFGVSQRTSLQNKGDTGRLSPHVLVMSATPIPRSLALILYGDLDVSIVDELPPGRLPVQTRIVPEGKRHDMYDYLRREIACGRQAYIVCPLVEDSEVMEDVRSAQATYEELKKNDLKDLRLGLTYGEQKADEKQAVLDGFAAGDIDVLVSTTVIEVGVNVPNATIMIIENAERFGLSQLHQLRGRVGRGSQASWCFLLAKESAKLRILTQTNDGFLVAQKDLELRGPGDLMGTRQSGHEIAGILMDGDIRLLDEAVQTMKIIRSDPDYAEEKKQIEEIAQRQYAEKVQHAAIN